MAFLHEEEDDHNTTDERKEYGVEDRYSPEPQKAHLTGWAAILGARITFGVIPTKQYYCTV